MKNRYRIMFRYHMQPREQIDEAVGIEERDFMLAEYRLAFRGQRCSVWAEVSYDAGEED